MSWWHPHFPHHDREPSERELLHAIVCAEKENGETLTQILAETQAIRSILTPHISVIEIEVSQDMATLTAKARWSDGTVGFDATHAQPADWPANVVFTEKSGDAAFTDNHDGTATVTAGTTDSVFDASYDTFTSADVTIPAAAAKIDGIEVEVS